MIKRLGGERYELFLIRSRIVTKRGKEDKLALRFQIEQWLRQSRGELPVDLQESFDSFLYKRRTALVGSPPAERAE